MKKINFGILGCGNVSRKFAAAARQSKYVNLVAIASRSEEKAEQYAALYGCEGLGDYNDLLARSDIDAVYIATPVGTHMQWCIAAAKQAKHILCEKTLASNEQEVQAIIRCCDEMKVNLFEGFAYQFHPQHQLLDNFLKQGKIGKPLFLEAKFGFPPIDSKHRYEPSLGGGALLDAGTYTLHIARKVFGREPLDAKAHLDNAGEEVDIQGAVLLNFGDGQTAQLAFGFNCYYRNYCAVWGTEGLLELERAFSIPDNLPAKLIHHKQDYKKEHIIEPYNVFAGEIEYFCENINKNEMQKKWLNESLAHIKTLDKIRLSGN